MSDRFERSPRKGKQRKDDGISRAGEHADPKFVVAASAAVAMVARVKQRFTTDDVWQALAGVCDTHDGRAMGSIMRESARAGVCQVTDEYRPSVRAACNRRPVRVWSSNLFRVSELKALP